MRAEARYVRTLRSLARESASEVLSLLLARTDASAPGGYAEHVERIIEGVRIRVGVAFDRHAAELSKANGKAMRVQGIQASDLGLDAVIAKRRAENVDLVVKAQRIYAASVKEVFEDPSNDGLAVDVLKGKLLERGSVSESRAELIARDQTLKMNGEITKTRQENAGIDSYVWTTASDERVRDEHAALDGETFSWSSPPSVGHPGADYQCRCVAIPVIPDL